ncbi:MAG TPA: agmatine deiminase family protein [Candidatus Yaniella excrementigallinarum]|nr:agmatine deiminase family protein [Candidatus Yaniella excrementigallinarum]
MAQGSRWITPAEMEPTQRVWMNFPRAGTVNWPAMWQLSSARRAWTRLAETLNQYVPVTLLVDPDDQQTVTSYVSSDIDTVIVPFNNALLRRTGFSVVVSRHPQPNTGRRPRRVLGMMDFTFNGFGRLAGVDYGLDDTMPGTLMDLLPDTNGFSQRIFSMMVSEGGSWVTDGNGTAIASEALLTDQQRNPGWSTNAVERELRRNVGIDHFIWLPNGLNRGAAPAGWGGYLDQLVAFHSPGRVLLHTQPDPSHPDHAVTNQTREILSAATDAQGNALEIIDVPAPQTHSDMRGPVNWSYLDYLMLNDVIIVPRFVDPNDSTAHELLGKLFPDHRIVPFMAQDLFDHGVSIRAITLPQPQASTRR